MKLKKLILGLISLTFVLNSSAIEDPTNNKNKNNTHTSPKAGASADCAPPSRLAYMNSNNVNTIIETGGIMWQDRANSAAGYEVPKNSDRTAIYSGALWMGGEDANGNLKIAAVMFRSAGQTDFWTGPLKTDNTAEIEPQVCNEYDRFWHLTKQEVLQFVAWYDCINGDGCPPEFDGYKVPKDILEWPAHGDLALNQPEYLAPFKDVGDPDGSYDPLGQGDYPYYDFNNEIDCRAVRDIRLFGDDTYWWVFNDKGNIHTETGGASIGMEIHAQAFAFTTNDEVNDMTFYNYELINRSTFRLTNTYFAQFCDADLGGPNDDYAGCDVMRGLGYVYNGDDIDADAQGAIGYGALPPAIGIDFFEGPYQDNDTINNNFGIGKNEALNGIGYYNPNDLKPDSIVDNERYGMRRFIYFSRQGTGPGYAQDPGPALQYYNYMRGYWTNGGRMVFGGTGSTLDPTATAYESDFMFPGNSDPMNWGTHGIDPGFTWTEVTAGNDPGDRRFLQSAGPFTLEPGAVNDITVGVVYARAIAGSAEQSVISLVQADSKAQALFDNCFDVLDGPDAPDLSGVELDREIILYISNKKGISNNYKNYPGDYVEIDPFIIAPEGETWDNKYTFQGYQIYQLSGNDVAVSELDNLDRARLVFQCDKRDGVTDMTNYEFDEELGASVPVQKVKDAANNGIFNSFSATTDLFAEGDPRLINFKTYYYIAISYAHNNYKPYSVSPTGFDGQKTPYLPSRKSSNGEVRAVAFTPHPQEPRRGGTIILSQYGDQPEITRIEGQGNGGIDLEFTDATIETLLENSLTPKKNFPTYKAGSGPVDIKVVDPTNVTDGQYTIKLVPDGNDYYWELMREGADNPFDPSFNLPVRSEAPISVSNEQIIPKWGISVNFTDKPNPGELLCETGGEDANYSNGVIGSRITYSDSTQVWLTGVIDGASADNQNWIRSGTDNEDAKPYQSYQYTCPSDSILFRDAFNKFGNLINGTWAPFPLTAYTELNFETDITCLHAPGPGFLQTQSAVEISELVDLQSVDIVFTSNQDLWTRCPVVEMQELNELAVNSIGAPANIHDTPKNLLRQSPSVGKDGKPDGTGNGMGWFPGYALNVETGERLNMAFGEDSWLGAENGADMIWNPTSTMEGGFIPGDLNRTREKVWGGKHYVYVFANSAYFKNRKTAFKFNMPSYDEGVTLANALERATNASDKPGKEVRFRNAWSTCIWAGIPMLAPQHSLLESDVTISLRVDKSYGAYVADTTANNGLPMYTWNMASLQTVAGNNDMAKAALNLIRVVPNPYYAFAEHYEQSQLDNYVKIINLPEQCTVSIYNVSGTQVRKFNKSDPSSEIKWDLRNQDNVPIAGGVYLIHVNADGVGEKIVKWFGVLRPVDLQGF